MDRQGSSPLGHALGFPVTDLALSLIQHGAKLVDKVGDSPRSLFVTAAAFDADPSVLQAMLDKGADINAQVIWAKTALVYSAWYANVSSVAFLLSYHANVALGDTNGETALDQVLHPVISVFYFAHPGTIDSDHSRQILHLLRKAGAR